MGEVLTEAGNGLEDPVELGSSRVGAQADKISLGADGVEARVVHTLLSLSWFVHTAVNCWKRSSSVGM